MPELFKCMKCNEPPFISEDDLGEHLMWFHGYAEEVEVDGEIKFKCTICEEIFDYESDLEMDLMWAHNLAIEIPEEQQKKGD